MAEAIRSAGAQISGHIYEHKRQKGGRQEREGIVAAQKRADISRQRSLEANQQGYTDTVSALNRGIDSYNRGYEDIQSTYQPYVDFGLNAMRGIGDASTIENSPAYQFRLNQGLQAVNRSMGRGGYLNSGNRLTGITNYAQGLASTEYEADFQRKMAQIQLGYGASSGIANAAGNRAAGIAGLETGIAGAVGTRTQNTIGIEGGWGNTSGNLDVMHGLSNAGQSIDIGNSWAATNMYMADQNAQAFDRYITSRYMPMSGGSSGGGGGDSMWGGIQGMMSSIGGMGG